jgi:type 2 lantibiotic biosynthesis protein LanM
MIKDTPPLHDIASTVPHYSPSWYRALMLKERLASFPHDSESAAKVAPDKLELAEQRLQKWKSCPPFEQGSYFSDRLALDGISEDDLRVLLSEPSEAVQNRVPQPPDWLLILTEAFASTGPSEPFDLLAAASGESVSAFLYPLKPLLHRGFQHLLSSIRELVAEIPLLPFQMETIGQLLFSNIMRQLPPILIKTLTLELHIARLQEQLKGETPAERFQSFIEQLCEPERMLALLEIYPVLARLVVSVIDQGINYGLEFLHHLCRDWPEICACFTPDDDPGMLIKVAMGVGDTHQQGRSVIRLEFASGFKLIYKPRSLAIDVHVQALVAWLNERGNHPAFRTLTVLNKGTYGWVEYVQPASCTSAEEVARFYERLGGYLALMYALEGNDFHFENIIAAGEHPMLIDLETLFQPYLRIKGNEDQQKTPQSFELLRTSVSRVGLLPGPAWVNAQGESLDVSGLGGKGGQLTPQPLPMFEETGTDEMRLVRKRLPIQDQLNRPTLNGTVIDALAYLDQVITGFAKIYRLLSKHRTELLTRFLPSFAEDEIRVVLRPTKNYGYLLQESYHPTVLQNALDRERLFDHLWASVPRQSHLTRVIGAEIDDLRRNDIPFFLTRPALRHLYTSQRQCIADFFEESGVERVERRIQQLSEQDFARQCWIIQASFATKSSERSTWKRTLLRPAEQEADREHLLRVACAVGDRLCELAIAGEGEISWLTLQLLQERTWFVSITDLDLYNGTAGICLFLAYLGFVTREARYTTLARQIITSIQTRLEQVASERNMISGLNGWGGFIYLYAHLGTLWQEPDLFAEAEKLIERFSDTIETDKALDIIGGSAGCLLSLLALYRVNPSTHVLKMALKCGEHLLAHATPMPQGVGWLNELTQEQPLTGYAHGNAGIAWSLLDLAAVSGQQRFRQTALAAMEYERSLFLPDRQNWPDLRSSEHGGPAEGKLSAMVAWCHGAPGIALARLASLAHIDDAAIRQEIKSALGTTLAHGFGMNHSLCHGDLGNLDVLLIASEVLDQAYYHAEVVRLTAMILESIERQGWSTGVPQGIETPGLMTGIAGIGYQLLRLAEPQLVPSVLLSAPPSLVHLQAR